MKTALINLFFIIALLINTMQGAYAMTVAKNTTLVKPVTVQLNLAHKLFIKNNKANAIDLAGKSVSDDSDSYIINNQYSLSTHYISTSIKFFDSIALYNFKITRIYQPPTLLS